MALTQAQKDFIAKVGAFAANDMKKSGVLASLKTAQAVHESGWGTSALATRANALFGIKADSRWKGKVYSAATKECYDGVNLTATEALFRAYDSWEDSLADHSAFLRENARYAAVIGETDYKKACTAIHAAGYATDPDYAEKLIKIIEHYGLTAYDAAQAGKGANMDIIQDFIPKGRKNRPGRVNPTQYVTIHNTGNASKGAGAKSHAAYVKGDAAANLPVSWHYTVDEKDIYQHLPDSEDAFHAGDGAGDGNRKSIGIEICMNSDGDLLKATDKAAELTAFLCGKYNIPVENVVQHQKWSGKNCPQLIRNGKPYNWNAFFVEGAVVYGSEHGRACSGANRAAYHDADRRNQERRYGKTHGKRHILRRQGNPGLGKETKLDCQFRQRRQGGHRQKRGGDKFHQQPRQHSQHKIPDGRRRRVGC
nr:mannosyl-glycoprotein [uncultured bacterium]